MPNVQSDPLAGYAEGVRQLRVDYRARATLKDRDAARYLVLTFLLLGAAVLGLVYAPLLARIDLQVLVDIQDLIETKREQRADIEFDLAQVTHDDFYAVVNDKAGHSVALGSNGATAASDEVRTGWQHRRSDAEEDLLAAAFHESEDIVVAVGSGGAITVSRNSGRSWRRRKTDITQALYDVVFGKAGRASTVVAVGRRGTLAVSHDRGANWGSKERDKFPNHLNAVTFSSAHGSFVAVGDDGLILFSDNGDEWTPGPRPTDSDLHAVDSAGETLVAVGDDGSIVVSTAGLHRWDPYSPVGEGRDFHAVALAPDGRVGYAVGDDGLIAVSYRGLQAWRPRAGARWEDLYAVVTDARGSTAIALGDDGAIFVGDDDGRRWDRVESYSPNPLTAATYDGTVAVFVGEQSTILRGEVVEGQRLRDMRVKIISNEFKKSIERRNLLATRAGVDKELKELEDLRELSIPDTDPGESSRFSPFFYQTILLRLGLIAVAFFLCHHLLGLVRESIRLAECYYARHNVVLLLAKDALPWNALTPEEFAQVVDTLSPEAETPDPSSKSMIDLTLRLAQALGRSGRSGAGNGPPPSPPGA